MDRTKTLIQTIVIAMKSGAWIGDILNSKYDLSEKVLGGKRQTVPSCQILYIKQRPRASLSSRHARREAATLYPSTSWVERDAGVAKESGHSIPVAKLGDLRYTHEAALYFSNSNG